jgi:hypothetical protein
MAWIEGTQIRPVNQFVGINDELRKIRGYIDDDHEAKVLLYKFLRQNITFATDVIMGVKLFPFQHIAIKAMLDTDYTLNVWSRGLSKCGFWHSLVPTNRGLKRMKDVEVGDYILSKDGANIVEDKVINPVEKTYKVTTSRGYESEGLDYHRVLTLTKDLDLEYKFSKDLKPGDCLVMRKGGVDTDQIDIFKNFNPEKKARKDAIIINPSNLSICEWYYFFGLLIGDGCFRKEVISITSEDKEIEEFLIYFAKQLNLNLRIANREDTNAKDYRISNKSLKEFLKFCGFEPNIKAKDKIIPLKLLECSKPNSQQLLRGLFDTDGFVSIAPRRRNSNGVKIGFTSSSIELIKQVRSLLLINDIIANTNVCFPGGSSNFGEKTYECNKAWSILIMGFENVKEFKDNIRFKIKRKQDKLSIIDKAKYQNGEFSNYIPYVGEYLIKNLNKKSIRRRKEGIKLSFRKNTSRRLANFITEFVEEKHASKIKKLTDENLFYDYVKNIEEGFEKTVDLQVENEHCYVSDGIINHNSFSCGIFAVLDAMFNQGIQIGILSPSFRQCLEKDHLVKTKNGLKKIKDVNKGEEIWARYKWQKIIDKWENELSEGIKLTTKKGYSLKGKNQHRVLIYNPEQREFVYKDLIDLKIGDSIPISISEDFVGQDVLKDFDYSIKYHHCNKPLLKIRNQQDFYYMLGSFIGDGNFRKRQSSQYSFSFTSGDTECSDWMEDYMNSILPENSVDRNLKEGGNTESVECNSNALGKLFEFMGYKANSIAINKEIPEKVLLSKKENISYFLKGLMDTDGTAVFGKKSKEVTLSTSSLKVAQQFQLLLLNFGIISKLGTEKARGEMEICGVKTFGNTSYKVRITGYHNIKKYYDQIGFKLDRKNKRIEKYLNSCKDRAKNRCIPIPKIGDYLDKKYKGVNVRSNPTKTRLKKALESGKITEREDIKLCNDIINEKIYFDTVSSLELEESIKTIDIEVENEHCYWGSGFINHNSKQIFRKIEDIASKPEAVYLNQVIGGRGGISRNNDEWIMNVGASTIRALPLGSGEKLRGFRFHRIIIDEMLLMPERIYNEVILPFLAVSENPDEQEEIAAWEDKLIAQGKMKEEDRYTWPNNKLIALSSASYQFEYLYEFYQIYERLITEENPEITPGSNPASRAIIHLAYDVAPRKLYDENLLKQSKATMSQSQFDREFGAVFTDESSGYFKVSKMKECTIPYGDNPSVEIQGDPNEEYIVSMDPSWAENDSSDNFALHVYKLHPKTRTSTVVHSYALAGARMKEHMKYLLYILQNFNVVALIGDYMGSVTFLNGCNESKLFKDAGIELKFLEAKFDKPEEYKEQILEAQKQYNKEDYKFCYLQNPSTGYIRQGNQYLQSCYDHKRVRFAAEAVDDAFNSQIAKRINGFDKIKYREKFGDEDDRGYEEDMKNIEAKMVDFVEHQKDMLSLIRAECSVIEIKTSPQGHQTFDLPATLKKTTGPKKARKDSYSAMVLGTWMVKIYYDLMFTEKQKVETFMPRFIK